MKELNYLFSEFVSEYLSKTQEFKMLLLSADIYKSGYYLEPGTKREQQSKQYYSGNVINNSALKHVVSKFIKTFSTVKNLFEYVNENGLWYKKFESFEEAINITPSIIDGLFAGFLIRNFELNQGFILTEGSIKTSMDEMQVLLKSEYYESVRLIHVQGLTGNVDEILIDKNAKLIRANFEIVRDFAIFYNLPDFYSQEFYEGDYILSITSLIKKCERFSGQNQRRNLEDAYQKICFLTLPGVFKMGKIIDICNDWSMSLKTAVGPYGHMEVINENRSENNLTPDISEALIDASKLIVDLSNLKQVENKIQYSLERLIKSKSTISFDDRVIDLAITFEFLINTAGADINLQMSLKVIKLVYENNEDPDIYVKLTKFYSLRSKIVHGNDKVPNNDFNKGIVDFTETVIQKAILKLILLSRHFSFSQIDTALKKSLHVNYTLQDLLKKETTS